MRRLSIIAFVIIMFSPHLTAALETDDEKLECRISFSSDEWSAAYARMVGQGVVSCNDGSSQPVWLWAEGVGVTAGMWKITDGKGRFHNVVRIDDVLGEYISLSGDIGISKAVTARILSKGEVTLSLTGKGEGFDVGIAINKVKITAKNRDQ